MRHNKGLENWACDRSTDEADLTEYVETARHSSGNMGLHGSLRVDIMSRSRTDLADCTLILALLEAAIRVKSTHLVKSCLKTRQKEKI